MKRSGFSFLIAITLSVFVFQPGAYSQPSQEYMIGTLNLLVDKTLDAYNLENHVEFYRYFADKMDPITRSHHFKKVYIDTYKEELGCVESWVLLEDESYLSSDFPVLVYQCEFEKNPCVFLTINFMKENDAYKIQQVRFDKVYY